MIPVILSGGSGTRLWPLSRPDFPKQFVSLFHKPLQIMAMDRLRGFTQTTSDFRIVTVESLRDANNALIAQHGYSDAHCIHEPVGRNTAPAIALLCHELRQTHGGGDAVVGVFPADQLVTNEKNFIDAVKLAARVASQGAVVTLGIQPTYPATGFGYIELSNESVVESGAGSSNVRALKVMGFKEKPDLATAEGFLNKKSFVWNAGIFIFSLKTMIAHLEKYIPEVWSPIQKSTPSSLAQIYASLPNISIDIGVMEKLSNLVCVPVDCGWSDVGSWEEVVRLEHVSPGMIQQNRSRIVEVKSANNSVVNLSARKTYAFVGVSDLVVVDSGDRVLICDQRSSQNVKEIKE